jgi:hypothetical protein
LRLANVKIQRSSLFGGWALSVADEARFSQSDHPQRYSLNGLKEHPLVDLVLPGFAVENQPESPVDQPQNK